MKFKQHYSSSRANLYEVIAANGKRLLIECGIRWPLLQKALNYDLTGIVGCLLTHEHADHSKAVHDVMKAGINVYASEGTFEALGVLANRRAIPVYAQKRWLPDTLSYDFSILRFDSNHDAQEPLLYTVKCDNEWLLFATDTSHIIQSFPVMPFKIIAIECAYDKDILQRRVDTQTINEELAKRLTTSHMKKQTTMAYLEKFCNLSRCQQIFLLHMSGDNIDKQKTKEEFEKKFLIETII